MKAFRKPDATGRSSRKRSGRLKNYYGPPPDQFWVWHTQAMKQSPAWSALGINARRALDRIEIEFMRHGIQENGKLPVTHEDFEGYGISPGEIRKALDELVELGFIEIVVGGREGRKGRVPSKYRLTWLPTQDGKPASNAWVKLDEAEVAERKRKVKRAAEQRRERRKKTSG